MAIVEYQNYLRKFPNGKWVDVALYRLGESLLKEERLAEAEKIYQRNLGIKGSQYVAPAAYRLASIFYNRKDYQMAAPYFAISATSPKKKIQLSSGYYRARSLRLSGDTKQSIEVYQKVADTEGENDYRNTALLAIGRLQAESKNNEAALEAFAKLAKQTSDTNYKAEALVMAGMLSSKLGKPEEATLVFRAGDGSGRGRRVEAGCAVPADQDIHRRGELQESYRNLSQGALCRSRRLATEHATDGR